MKSENSSRTSSFRFPIVQHVWGVPLDHVLDLVVAKLSLNRFSSISCEDSCVALHFVAVGVIPVCDPVLPDVLALNISFSKLLAELEIMMATLAINDHEIGCQSQNPVEQITHNNQPTS